VAELACAMALAWPSTRRRAGWACAALFVVVFPANIKMALDSLDGSGSALVAWLRLPLQIPLIIWALYLARNAERHRATGPAYSAEAGATRSPAPGAEETAGSIGSSRLRS